MSITIVSTPTPSAQALASDGTLATTSLAPGFDFASMLLGQLGLGIAEASSGTTSVEAIDDEIVSDEAPDENAVQNDTLTLLAALITPQAEQRNDVTTAMQQAASTPMLTGKITALPTDNIENADAAEVSVATQNTAISPTSIFNTLTTASADDSAPRQDAADTSPALLSGANITANRQKAAKIAVPTAAVPDDKSPAPSAQAAEPAATATGGTSPQATAWAANQGSLNVPQETATSLSVAAPLRDQHWNSDFSQKVVWLATNHQQSAELTLNPPNMGSIEVSLQIDNDKATATFVSASADVRESIETALPRLREMLAGAGIELGQTNVSAESFRQASSQEDRSNGASRARNDNAILAAGSQGIAAAGQTMLARGKGLVDLFA